MGSVVFEFIGAFFKWLYFAVYSAIKGRRAVSFKQIWEGDRTDFQERIEYGISNLVLGIAISLGLIIFLMCSGV